MAISSNVVWRNRVSGSNNNGGGFDATIAGAGTDYTDQDAAQLSLSDLACANNTTLTSATGGFTSQMIGNCIRVASGTNFTAGYYFVTGYTDTHTVTLDRNPTTGATASAGVGSLGGAFATLGNFWAGGSITQPSITSPLAAGHTVYIRGSGSDNPTTDDYTYSPTDYAILPSGNNTAGKIRIIGYNGRPRINYGGLLAYTSSYINLENVMLFLNASAAFSAYGFFSPSIAGTSAKNVKVDTNGVNAANGLVAISAIGCWITNSGTTSAGTSGSYGLNMGQYGGACYGNVVEKQRAGGISILSSISSVVNNIVVNNAGDGIDASFSGGTYGGLIAFNTIDSNGGDGFKFTDASNSDSALVSILNNIFSNNGGYGVNFAHGSASLNDKLIPILDYNNYYNNTSGAINGASGGAHDLTVNPNYAGGGDYTPSNTALDAAFPTSYP